MKTYTTVPEHLLAQNPHPVASQEYWAWDHAQGAKFSRPVVLVGQNPLKGVYGWVMIEYALAGVRGQLGEGRGYWFYLDEAGADALPPPPASDPEPLRKAQERIAALEATLARVREAVA